MTPGTSRVRQGVASEKVAAVIRLGKSCERVMDRLEAAGGTMALSALADAVDVKRPRDLTRRKNLETGKGRDGFVTRLEDVGVLTVDGDTVKLAVAWLDRINEERDRAGEIALYRRDMARYNREREGYRNRDKVKVSHHYANVGADGWVEELRTDEPEPPPDRGQQDHVSALAATIRSYLDRTPGDACQPPGWIANSLWCHDLYPGKPTPAEARAAIDELGGESYLRERLERSREVA